MQLRTLSRLLPQRFSQASRLRVPLRPQLTGDSFSGFLCQSFHEIQRDQLNGIPPEILNRCRVLKEKWRNAQPQMRAIRRTDFKEEQVNHSHLPHLQATVQLKQINSVGAAGPHFLIACEDICRNRERSGRLGLFRLPGLTRLTRREREVAQLACGRSRIETPRDALRGRQPSG